MPFEVLHENLEVHHLRLQAVLLGPRGGFVRDLSLEVQSDATIWVPGLNPACAVYER